MAFQDISMATDWLGSYERRYLRHTHFHIKRSLRFAELHPATPPLSNSNSNSGGDGAAPEVEVGKQQRRLYVPRLSRERLQNEADSLRFVGSVTDIPVPRVLALFEDFGACYLVTETVPGVEMARLREGEKGVVYRQLHRHMRTLHALRSNVLGGPGGQVIVPRPVMRATYQDHWELMRGVDGDGDADADAAEEERPGRRPGRYVFCHGDLSEHNVMVDPETLEIRGILDWEHAGFWPEFFEGQVYTRIGVRAKKAWEGDCRIWVGRMLGFLRENEVRRCRCEEEEEDDGGGGGGGGGDDDDDDDEREGELEKGDDGRGSVMHTTTEDSC